VLEARREVACTSPAREKWRSVLEERERESAREQLVEKKGRGG
jgi:hypothetical protein